MHKADKFHNELPRFQVIRRTNSRSAGSRLQKRNESDRAIVGRHRHREAFPRPVNNISYLELMHVARAFGPMPRTELAFDENFLILGPTGEPREAAMRRWPRMIL
jgi:hypothetical protein